jgi:hypothetical protein
VCRREPALKGDARYVQKYLCGGRTVFGTLSDRGFRFDILAVTGFRGESRESDELRIAKPASFYRGGYNIDQRPDASDHTIDL